MMDPGSCDYTGIQVCVAITGYSSGMRPEQNDD